MNLIDLLTAIAIDQEVVEDQPSSISELSFSGLEIDSRKVTPGDIFLAYPGHAVDGRDYIESAIDKGAVAILAEPGQDQIGSRARVPVIEIPQLRDQIGLIASCYYGNPSSQLTVTGITGTNGKTSCTHFLAQILTSLGKKVATIGTLGSGVFPIIDHGELTTPDAVTLQRLCRDFVDQGVTDLVMEVSSHSLDQGRVSGIVFDFAVFTNLSRDHLDYHESMEAYGAAKRKLFDFPNLKGRVVNGDDKLGKIIATKFNNQYGVYRFEQAHQVSDNLYAYSAKSERSGLTLNWVNLSPKLCIRAPLLGQFNGENLAAVVVTLLAMGIEKDLIIQAASRLTPVPGRMELVGTKAYQPLCIVDYAHTPEALQQVLITARDYVEPGGKLICLFGCGGDRDQGKRPLMAGVAYKYSDRIVVTSDNPRTESPMRIIEDILQGVDSIDNCIVNADRASAIHDCILNADTSDVIVIAGKGHEDYQITVSGKHYFSDKEQVLMALANKTGGE